MTYLSQAVTGKQVKPATIFLYGVEGVGKSSLAAQTPKPIFLGTEDGTAHLDVTRLPVLKKLADVFGALGELAGPGHPYKTVVIDSVDWLEPLVLSDTCSRKQWEDIEAPGYGKGYVAALDTWREVIAALDAVKASGRNVILIGHSHTRTVRDPHLNESYDRFEPKLNVKAAALLKEWADTVLFANFRLSLVKDKGAPKAKAYGDGSRVMYTERRPAFDAKNRQGLPFELDLSWEAFERAANAYNRTAQDVRAAVTALLKECKDQTLVTLVTGSVERAGDNVTELTRIENKLKTHLD